ncbi:hypothetical protein [Streptomyces lavendulocolor]|uniref:hypothetical protein n=1 Tax=Streptomyces lavendulocolor TaxID=67316 RepID=UPI003C2DBE66
MVRESVVLADSHVHGPGGLLEEQNDAAPPVTMPPAGSGAGTQNVPAGVDEDGAGPPTTVVSLPRGRTALLVAAAAVIGLVAGVVAGYGVQTQRPPTPLPPLAQPGLTYPAAPLPKGKEPRPLTVAEDRSLKTDGDLRKLVISKPKGLRDAVMPTFQQGVLSADGWLSPDGYAREYLDEDSMFQYYVRQDIRRVAAADWVGGTPDEQIAVRLVQFRPGGSGGALQYAESQMEYMPTSRGAGNMGRPIKGSSNGRYYVYSAQSASDGEGGYHARALGYRGDVMFDIHIFDAEPISETDIRTLAERQLGRL